MPKSNTMKKKIAVLLTVLFAFRAILLKRLRERIEK